MKWIIKPNLMWDNIKEPKRGLLFIGTVIFMAAISILLKTYLYYLLILGFVGLYRILYFIIIYDKRTKELQKKLDREVIEK